MPHYAHVPYVNYLTHYKLLIVLNQHHLIHPTHQYPLKFPCMSLLYPLTMLEKKILVTFRILISVSLKKPSGCRNSNPKKPLWIFISRTQILLSDIGIRNSIFTSRHGIRNLNLEIKLTYKFLYLELLTLPSRLCICKPISRLLDIVILEHPSSKIAKKRDAMCCLTSE